MELGIVRVYEYTCIRLHPTAHNNISYNSTRSKPTPFVKP